MDLVILTHIDDDHIDGFLKWFGKDKEAIRYVKGFGLIQVGRSRGI